MGQAQLLCGTWHFRAHLSCFPFQLHPWHTETPKSRWFLLLEGAWPRMGARVSSGTFPAGISLLLEPGGLLQHGEFLAVGDLKKKMREGGIWTWFQRSRAMVWLGSSTGEGWDCAGNLPEGAPRTEEKTQNFIPGSSCCSFWVLSSQKPRPGRPPGLEKATALRDFRARC